MNTSTPRAKSTELNKRDMEPQLLIKRKTKQAKKEAELLKPQILKQYELQDFKMVTSVKLPSMQSEARQVFFYILNGKGYSPQVISEAFGVTKPTVTESIKRISGFIDVYKEYQWIKELTKE